MRTRSQKLALENAGVPPSPPQQLPPAQKRTRAPKKKTSRVQQVSSVGAEGLQDVNSEETASSSPSSSAAIVHPVQTRSRAPRSAPAARLPPPTRSRSKRVPAASPVAVATQPSSSRGPGVPQALIHVWVDVAAEELASAQPVSDPNILLSLPADSIPNLLKFIATNPTSGGHGKLTICPAITTISISPSSNKRKLPADTDLPPPAQRARIEPTTPPVRQKTRRAFSRAGLSEARLEPNVLPAPIHRYEPSDIIDDSHFFKRVDRYGPNGNLQLGLVPISISSEEGSKALYQPSPPVSPPVEEKSVDDRLVEEQNGQATEQPKEAASSNHEPAPGVVEENAATGNVSTHPPIAAPSQLGHGSAIETPRRSGWGLGSFMNTARRYIPLPTLGRRVEPMAPLAENPVTAPSLVSASPSTSTGIVLGPVLTGPNADSQNAATLDAPAIDTTTATKSREHRDDHERRRRKHREHPQNKSPKKGNRARNRAQSDGRRQIEHGSLRSQAHSKEARAREDFRREAEMATTPGTKRKRLPSPDTIPNPRGCSYGMDLDYFEYVSSDEDEIVDTPTKPRPAKSRRISKPDDSDIPMVGDPQKARPYSGVLFAKSDPAYHGGNVFSEVKTADKAMRMASETRASESQKQAYLSKTSSASSVHAASGTPTSNLAGSFKVPEPSDSDSDHEESPRETSRSGIEKGSTKAKDVSRQMEALQPATASISTEKSPEPWNKSPPPRPTPGHKALPSAPKLKASKPPSTSSDTMVSSNSGSTSSGSRLPPSRVAPLPVNRPTDSEALRKVREKALHYKPRKPSTLSQSSRLYSSPTGDSGEEVNESTAEGVAGARKDTERNEVPAVQANTSLGGASHVDGAQKYTGLNKIAAIQPNINTTRVSNVGEAQAQMDTGLDKIAAIQASIDTTGASNVGEAQTDIGLDEITPIQADTKSIGASNVDEAQMDTEYNKVATIQGAGNIDGDSGDNSEHVSASNGPESFNAYEQYFQTVDPEVAKLLAETPVDFNAAGDIVKAGITQFAAEAKGKGKEAAIAPITTEATAAPTAAAASTAAAAPSSLSHTPSPEFKYVRDPEVESFIESMWTPADTQLSATIFESMYADFLKKEFTDEEAEAVGIKRRVAI